MNITLPYNFEPRPYQLPVLCAMDSGKRRASLVWHRRSGKDITCLNILIKNMVQRVGAYYYMFPEALQGRRALWEGISKEGKKFMDYFPKDIIDGEPNQTEMKIKIVTGSIFQIVGADNYNSLMSTNPVGMVLSEYSLHNPMAWSFFRPIVAENNGWAIFNFTPRGENHAYQIHELAKNDPNWFSQILTVNDTSAISTEVLEQERKEIIRLDGNDSLYQQEYFCNFTVPLAGAYYAAQISLAYKEGRVGNVPYEDRIPVDTWWDLGVGDATAIWFTQSVGAEVRVIDYVEETGQGFPHFSKVLSEKGYVYGSHNAPHDIKVREWGIGKCRIETAKNLGINFKIVPNIPIIDGIDCARSLFRKCWFDNEKCRIGLNALKNYRKEWNEQKKCFFPSPCHDWTFHAADAFRYCAIGLDYVLSPTKGYYIHKDERDKQTGWHNGNYTPEWAKADEVRLVIR